MDDDLLSALYDDINRWLSCSGNTVRFDNQRYTSINEDIFGILNNTEIIYFYPSDHMFYVYRINLHIKEEIIKIYLYPTTSSHQNIDIQFSDEIGIYKLYHTKKITDEKFTNTNELHSFLESYVTKQIMATDIELSCDNFFELLPMSTIQFMMNNIYHKFDNLTIDI